MTDDTEFPDDTAFPDDDAGFREVCWCRMHPETAASVRGLITAWIFFQPVPCICGRG